MPAQSWENEKVKCHSWRNWSSTSELAAAFSLIGQEGRESGGDKEEEEEKEREEVEEEKEEEEEGGGGGGGGGGGRRDDFS